METQRETKVCHKVAEKQVFSIFCCTPRMLTKNVFQPMLVFICTVIADQTFK